MLTRQPVRLQAERTAMDVIAGLGAVLALTSLIGGVPYGLIRLFGSPIPDRVPSLDTLTQQVTDNVILSMLAILVWFAWLQLVICVVVEIYAGIRRVGLPARVPLSGAPQAIAHRLVTAALLLFAATAVVAPILKAAGPVKPPTTTSAGLHPGAQAVPAVLRDTVEVLDTVQKSKKVYVVQPPHGRHHESLWEIAEKCLGDGRRYPEIYRLNKHKEQPDGVRLRIADLIRPGWVLDMPDDAINVHIVPAEQGRAKTLKDHRGKPAELDGRTHYAKPGAVKPGKSLADQRGPKPRGVARELHPLAPIAPGTAQPVVISGGGGQADPYGGRTNGTGGWLNGLTLPDYLAAASLAAAGLLAVLGRRRREQLWRRAFGHRLPRPEGDAALAELALRLGADAPGSRMLDIGLRHMSRELAAQDRTPPTIYGVHLSAESLDLWIHPAERGAPTPWHAHDGGQVWRLPAADGRALEEAHDVLAPYPGLVSLGTNESGRVLIDLEAAHGLINVRGPAHATQAALAAIAVELASNRWSDHMHITLVGFGEELALIAPDRIRAVKSLYEVLPELESRTAEVRKALESVGAGSVLTGRARGVLGESWMPHYVLMASTPTPDEAERLAVLARTGTRMAAGYVVAGDIPGNATATWTWEVSSDGRATIDVLGFDVEAQLLPQRQFQAVVELFRTAAHTTGVPLAEDPDDRPLLDTALSPAVDIRVLGAIEINAPGELDEARLPLCTELLVYLATHPAGVHPGVLTGAVWPRGVQSAVRDATVARVRDWLGADSRGAPNLRTDDAGRLHLGPEVRTDWLVFRDHVRRARRDSDSEAALLDSALGLIRGPLLAGHPPGRYAWLAADELEYDVAARVADAARRLCDLRLAAADGAGAVAAAKAGLLLAADDEGLWRDLLRATHAVGDDAQLSEVVEAAQRRAAPYGSMAPETEALVDELLPSFRLQAVNELVDRTL